MRLLSGAPRQRDGENLVDQEREWVGLTAGDALADALAKLRSPESLGTGGSAGTARTSFATISRPA